MNSDDTTTATEEQMRLLEGKENVFVGYEKEVLDLLVRPHLGDGLTSEVVRAGELVALRYTGVGYFLTVRHSSLPIERNVPRSPNVSGKVEVRRQRRFRSWTPEELLVGFIVFIEGYTVTIECFSYGTLGTDGRIGQPFPVPTDIRERQVIITSAP